MKKSQQTPPTETEALAKFYAVTMRTIQRWKKHRPQVPVHDAGKLAIWAATQKNLPDAFQVRLLELTGRPVSRPAEAALPAPDPDWAEFCRLAESKPGSDPKASMRSIATARDFAQFKLEKASAAGDLPAQKFQSDLLVKFESCLHDAELRAQRLGRDLGESFSASDVDRLGQAMAYWLMSSADVTITQITSGLNARAAVGPLDREAVRHVVEPVVLAERVLAPLVRATKVNAPIKLPDRFVEAVKNGLAMVLEDGPSAFDALYAVPVPMALDEQQPAIAPNSP